jgi:putative Mg2+ transporter-C (MgtC) family protein
MLTPYEITLRLLLAALAGGIIGLDRERHGRAAGLRTMLLACVAASAAAILAAQNLSNTLPATWTPDPRVIQGVLSGIGFLGAGSILREGNAIRGVTTAASLWFITVVGLLLGSGFLFIAAVTWAIGLVALVFIPFFERLVPNELHSILSITLELHSPIEPQIHDAITSAGGLIVSTAFERDLFAKTRTLHLTIRYHHREGHDIAPQLESSLATLPGLTQIHWNSNGQHL